MVERVSVPPTEEKWREKMEKFKNLMTKVGVGATAALASASAFATGPDYSGLTDAVDFSAVQTAMIAIAGIVFGTLVVYKGIKWLTKSV